MDKRTWLRLVKSETFPRELRFLRATLLLVAELMKTDGVLEAWEDELVAKTGLYPRTLGYHLARAVDAGWLGHPVKGGHGRRGRYEASCRQHSRQLIADNSGANAKQVLKQTGSKPSSCQQGSRQSATDNYPQVVGNVVAESEQIGASESEHQALNPNGKRRPGHDGVSVPDVDSLASSLLRRPTARLDAGARGPARPPKHSDIFAAVPTTEIANTRLNDGARDLRSPGQDQSSAEDNDHNADQPQTVTTPDPDTLEIDGAALDAKFDARGLRYRRTGGLR